MKHWQFIKGTAAIAVAAAALHFGSLPSYAQDDTVTISHYFTGDLGQKGITEIFNEFKAKTGITVEDSPIGHEDFKTGILVRAAGHSLPDVFSYWAGARTQFVVDAGNLAPIDDMWSADGLDKVVAKSIADGATLYNGKRYLIPFGYHYAGMFYNPKVMARAGITAMPKTWDDLARRLQDAEGQGHRRFRARLEEPLAGAVLVRLHPAAHRRAGLSGQADGGQGFLHRSRGQDGARRVEEPLRRRLLRRQLQRRRLDRRCRPGGQGHGRDDPDGHVDHRLLEPERPQAGRRLRLLRIPEDEGRRAERGGRPGRRSGHRRQCPAPGECPQAALVADQRSGRCRPSGQPSRARCRPTSTCRCRPTAA